jgi:hypothetical protein
LPIETTGELFAGGASIELIVDAETECLNLLLWDGENYSVAPRIEHRGQVYVPASLDPSVLRAVRWPTKCADYGSTNKLFTAVRESLMNHGFPEEVALATTYGVFPTWFPECVPHAPCMEIKGPRPEANLLLQLLGCLVRHALPLAEVRRAALCSLPSGLQPTLLISEEHLAPSTLRLLSASNNPNAYTTWRDSLVDLYSAKAVYRGDALGDSVFGDATLRVNLAPFRGRLPVLDPRTQQEIATALQAQFLGYRLRNISKVRDSRFDLPAFASPIRILARVLGACIVDAPELQAGLVPLLEEYQERIRGERWIDLRCVVIEALLYYCHKGQRDRVYVGKITDTTATILKGRGKTPPPDEELIKLVGSTLDDLGFFRKRDAKGLPVRLTETVRRRIHQLAGDYDVAAVQEGLALCPHCSEITAAGESSGEPKSQPEE